MDKRKSPYLVLGVPYGAAKGDAAKAFARATKRLRRTAEAPFDLEDLNWALHAVEQRADDPGTSIDDYRMPANARVYEVPGGHGMLNPPVEPIRRQTPPSGPADIDLVVSQVIREVASQVVRDIREAPLPSLHRFSEEGA